MVKVIDGKDLYKKTVGLEIEARRENNLFPSRDAISGLRMMIDNPGKYQSSEKINPSKLRGLLHCIYIFWTLNFSEVYKEHRNLIE